MCGTCCMSLRLRRAGKCARQPACRARVQAKSEAVMCIGKGADTLRQEQRKRTLGKSCMNKSRWVTVESGGALFSSITWTAQFKLCAPLWGAVSAASGCERT